MSSQEQIPTLDKDALHRLRRDLPVGGLDKVLKSFATELVRRGEILESLDVETGTSELAALAHGLKGSAATFGAPGLATAAEDLEIVVGTGQPEDIRRARDAAATELHGLIDELNKVVESGRL